MNSHVLLSLSRLSPLACRPIWRPFKGSRWSTYRTRIVHPWHRLPAESPGAVIKLRAYHRKWTSLLGNSLSKRLALKFYNPLLCRWSKAKKLQGAPLSGVTCLLSSLRSNMVIEVQRKVWNSASCCIYSCKQLLSVERRHTSPKFRFPTAIDRSEVPRRELLRVLMLVIAWMERLALR